MVELQAFPSLYALMLVQVEIMAEVLAGMPGLDRRWSFCFEGRSSADVRRASAARAILAGEPEESVILLDLAPEKQKTYPDFVATKLLVGVDAVCPTALVREGNRLFRRVGERLVQVRRLYNRVVFDELEVEEGRAPVPVQRSARRHVVLAPELVLDLVEVHAALHRSPRAPAVADAERAGRRARWISSATCSSRCSPSRAPG